MATSRIGYYNTGATPDFGTISADNQRAYTPDALASTVIFYEMGARCGRNGSSTPTCRMGIGDTSNGLATGSPSTRRGYTNSFTPSTQMTYGGDGATYTQSLITPFVGQAGDAFSLVLTSTNYILGHGMVQAASYSGKDNYNFYDKANSSSIPTDPIGGSAHYEGHMALWATGEVNVAPNTPTALSPSGTLVSTDTTPQLLSSFADSNETLPNGASYDKLSKYEVQVRRTSDSVTMWTPGTFTATATEQTNRQVNRTYAGTALVAGVSYQHRHRHQDLAGAWSAWSAWTSFTINAGGTVVTTSATFNGKQNSQTPSPFAATWSHPNPLNADRAIVRILDANSNVVQTMTQASPVTVSVANGGTISVTWAQTGFTALARGGIGYKWQMQARDTGAAWSPWSSSVAFTVNATPNTPSSLSPTGSAALTSAPLLSASATDPDDTLGTATVTAEILRADGTSVSRTMTYNATSKKYEKQTVVGVNEVQRITRGGTATAGTFTITVPANVRGAQSTTAAIAAAATASQIQSALELLPNVGVGRVSVTGGPLTTATTVNITFLMELSATDLAQITVTNSLTGTSPTLTPSTVTAGVTGDWAGFQTLQWRAQASDGTSSSAFSAYSTFLYGAGPAVTVTAPADEATVTTATYRVTWTVPSGGPQAKYQVVLTEVDAFDVPIVGGTTYDSGLVTSTNLFHDVPSGIFRNGERYQVVVSVTNATPLTGASQPQQFNVTFTPPATIIGFVASALTLHAATDSDAVRLDWQPTTLPADQFIAYDLYRTALGPAAQASGFTAADVDDVVGDRVYIRRITNPSQIAYIDGNVTSGVAYLYELEQVVKQGLDELRSVAAQATISVQIPHVLLTAALDPESFGVELRHKAGGSGDAFLQSSLSQSKRKVVPVGGKKGRTVASPFYSWADAGEFEIITDRFMTADERLRRINAIAERGGTLCLRDFTGLKRYLTLDSLEIQRFSVNHYRVALGFTEEWFVEGELV